MLMGFLFQIRPDKPSDCKWKLGTSEPSPHKHTSWTPPLVQAEMLGHPDKRALKFGNVHALELTAMSDNIMTRYTIYIYIIHHYI